MLQVIILLTCLHFISSFLLGFEATLIVVEEHFILCKYSQAHNMVLCLKTKDHSVAPNAALLSCRKMSSTTTTAPPIQLLVAEIRIKVRPKTETKARTKAKECSIPFPFFVRFSLKNWYSMYYRSLKIKEQSTDGFLRIGEPLRASDRIFMMSDWMVFGRTNPIQSPS